MVHRLDVVRILSQYLSGDIDVASLRRWLVEVDVSGKVDGNARQLIFDIEGLYAEFSDGLVSEAFLRERFLDMLEPTSKAAVNPRAAWVDEEKADQRLSAPYSLPSELTVFA